MSLELVAFILLSAGALGSAAVVVVARNPIYSAISLVISFFFLAGLYLTLNANFVAIIQVLVYAGAIMVLFMFVIMLLNLSDDELGESRWNFHKLIGALGALVAAGVLVWAIVGAQQSYLGEPAYARNHSIERLRRMANMHPFATPGEREAYFSRLGELRGLAVQKVRIERGSESVRADACREIAALAPALDAGACDSAQGQSAARGYAGAQVADYDVQLAALEAAVDPSPVPASWRGARATRISSLEPTREERAVLAVVDTAYATRLEQLVDRAASRLLSPDELGALNAYAASRANLPGSERSTQELRALAMHEPGARMRLALAQSEAIERIVDTRASAHDASAQTFKAESAALIEEYRLLARDVLVARRTGQHGLIVQALTALHRQVGDELTFAERQQLRAIIDDLGRGGPRWLGLWLRPAVYDEDEFGSVEAVGTEMLTRWLLPFEVTALLLLVGILGATVVAKRRT